LRQGVLAFEAIPQMGVEGFLCSTCVPAVLVAVLEDLCHEGKLHRTQATQLEECILARTDRDGGWK
jgi:hypothetical protein